jgi:RHS repeat-associated protein
MPSVLTPSFEVRTGALWNWEHLYGGYRSDEESGLLCLRNRFYHPSLGLFLIRDLIGYAGGYNLYLYVDANPVLFLDPNGLIVHYLLLALIGGALLSIPGDDVVTVHRSHASSCRNWAREEALLGKGWLDFLPNCPCSVTLCPAPAPPLNPNPAIWMNPGPALQDYHPGATWDMRSHPVPGDSGQQCEYDANGMLITGGEAAGTPDRVSPNANVFLHSLADVSPFWDCKDAGLLAVYLTWRPPNNGNNCPPLIINPVPEPFQMPLRPPRGRAKQRRVWV